MKASLRLASALALIAATLAPEARASAQDAGTTTPTTSDAAAATSTPPADSTASTTAESAPVAVESNPPPVAAPALTQNTERVTETAPTDDMTDWTAGAGGSMNAGNTQNYTINLGSSFAMIRGSHGLALNAQFNLGAADPTPTRNESPHLVKNARNFLARGRYDFFMTRLDAMFVGVQYRWDPFAGLELRQQYQVGYQRNFIRTDKHRLWAEIGYDYTHDNTTTAVDNVGCSGDSCNYHSVRAFAGYDNRLNEHVSLLTGFELLENLQQASHVRFNWQTNLVTRVAERLAIETKFRWLYDSRPAGATKYRNDAQLLLALVFDLM